VEVDDDAGYRRVGGQGDCPGYCSYAYGCVETGVGVVALGNGPWRPPSSPASVWAVVDHGLALLRAAALGRDLPPDPSPPDPEPAGDEAAPPAPGGALPAELAALTGTYAAWNPWIPRVRVRAGAGDGLVLVWPEGDEEPLTPLPDGGFRLGEDPASPDRVQFGAVVEGRPMQAVVNGWAFDRVD
jgi:hypothetical protein